MFIYETLNLKMTDCAMILKKARAFKGNNENKGKKNLRKEEIKTMKERLKDRQKNVKEEREKKGTKEEINKNKTKKR